MSELFELIQSYLACPICHGRLIVNERTPICQQCHFAGQVHNDVVLMMEYRTSFFDEPFASNPVRDDEFLRMFRLEQEKILLGYLKSGSVVCDVGCGRMLQYQKPADCFVIGVDPSVSSIIANNMVNLKVLGTACSLPIPSNSVDVVVCFYSLHHMVGNTIAETSQNVMRAFKEFTRVLKQSGSLFVFEVNPRLIASVLQDILWNDARRILSSKLDMYLWPSKALRTLGCKTMPDRQITHKTFHVHAWKMLSPFVALPKVRLPRFLIPVDLSVYHWHA
jgi:ubiquinone/menaquinone biosynthesis C-methylase UbiE/uncharacterized protein YbaR (Trm112 family)